MLRELTQRIVSVDEIVSQVAGEAREVNAAGLWQYLKSGDADRWTRQWFVD